MTTPAHDMPRRPRTDYLLVSQDEPRLLGGLHRFVAFRQSSS